jgi:hypothetical protein
MASDKRPFPPSGMGTFADDGDLRPSFIPAPEVFEWATEQLLTEGGKIHNEDHKHLEFADIAFLWAAGGYEKQMRRVIGQTEEVAFRCSAWQKGRQEQQMWEWFGRTPEYLITLDASYCANCSDLEFCALVEHELYHIGQKVDAFGAPAFTRDGLPKIGIRGHDVEEFVGVVQRYGVGHPEGRLAQLVEAAKSGATVGALSISQACGTCLLRAA